MFPLREYNINRVKKLLEYFYASGTANCNYAAMINEINIKGLTCTLTMINELNNKKRKTYIVKMIRY